MCYIINMIINNFFMINPQLAMTFIKIAGLTNILFLLLTFFSCRCLLGPKISQKLAQYEWFKKFYRWHCYFWWGFYLSVIIHTLLAWHLFGFGF